MKPLKGAKSIAQTWQHMVGYPQVKNHSKEHMYIQHDFTGGKWVGGRK